ncbi:RrF2 family transcriptional regulator [Algoriphagus persicinus]|uniref:RrF2 family transcriptional regulator n=1 Tax=Algoriphagus persicinus TaxID=3108754 RepID=UPI002B39E5EB|nr:Rrf2 family transcriptional regulator [Algoriphagus sp. E1-3-M2]MEB2786236.1 Rrf2 family transcriptional regulator [Algoriphagus sp. E1-3-M2]
MFSKACEYGIRAMTFIAMKSTREEKAHIPDISKAIDSPRPFTATILQKLVKGNMVTSTKGFHGGFHISAEGMRATKLTDIVKAIDGAEIYNGGALSLAECSERKPCPLHDKFKLVRDDLKAMLESTSLEDLASQLEDGTAFLKV